MLSQTLLFFHLYDNPPAAVAFADGMEVREGALEDAVRHFEEFYEDTYLQMMQYGEVEEIHTCDNIGDHIIGNTYVKFHTEVEAKMCLEDLNGKFYSGRVIYGEYCPVTDFGEAKCRQFKEGNCDRGGYCNFMHLKHVPKPFRKAMAKYMFEAYPQYKERRKQEEEETNSPRARDFEKEPNADGPRNDRVKEEEPEKPARDQTSEERRAMIASWNQEVGV
jgi:splicing factor U2AF subunit